MLDQVSDDWEVIVVNDSGQPLPAAAWQRSPFVYLIQTHRRERSVARNAGAAIAQGRYLHFLDDDDWLLPGALTQFRAFARTCEAAWIYGSSRLVDDADVPIIELHHGLNGNGFMQVIAGEWIPLQASFIKADAFFACGGFNPLLGGGEDVDLCRRILLHSDLAEIPAVVACIHTRGRDSSTDYDRLAEGSRWAREQLFAEPGAFARMRASAQSPYLRGRIVRAYLTSLVWNAQHRKFFVAMSRGLMALAGMGVAAQAIGSRDFWRAIRHPYQSETFARGFRDRAT